MTELKTILRWLGRAAILQSTLIFLVYLILTERLSIVRNSLTDALYKSHVATEQLDKINETFSSISSLTLWIFVAGIASTSLGYGLLRSIINKEMAKRSRE